MKRNSIGIILFVLGFIAVIFAVSLLLQSREWIVVGFSVAATLLGLFTILCGYRVLNGERIKDILREILEIILLRF